MLGTRDAIATIGVKNLEVAKKFYAGTLGLKQTESGESGVQGYKSGNAAVMVYESKYAGTNKATALTWAVGDDLDGIIRDLKGKGVTFERYDLPNTTHQGDVHVSGKTRVAWFKDPDGNILSLVNG